MSIKYWEFEDAPFKEKLKSVNVRDIAKIFFNNETEAYRFGRLLLEVKQKENLRLADIPKDIPVATAKRYLDRAVEFGLLKHENSTYALTNRYAHPLRNIATYISEWMKSSASEDIDIEFATANIEKQQKRGGRPLKDNTTSE